jgi:hypothetical protein
MSRHSAQFITEALLTRWIEQSESSRTEQDTPRALPVTRLCHPLRGMLAINGCNEIVGVGTRFAGTGGVAESNRVH